MQLDIQLLNVSPEQAFTAKGDAYEKLIVTFKNLRFNKTEAKQIFPFGNKQLFEQLRTLAPGFYAVTQEKSEKGFWEWQSIDRQDAPPAGGAPAPVSGGGKPPSAPPAGGRPQYETHEERAAKQVFIIKQSSLTNAVNLLTATKKAVTQEEVTQVAQYFTDWVLGNGTRKEAAKAAVKDDVKDPFIDDQDIPF